MSMLGNFRQISPSLLERIKAKPALVKQVVRYRPDGSPPDSDAEAFLSLLPSHMRKAIDGMPPEARADFLAYVDASVAEMPEMLKDQIAVRRRPKPVRRAARAAIDPAEMGPDLDLEKAWHGVHFLLCGSATEAPSPLGTAVLGGTEVGPDLGYGPARYLEVPEVKTVADALAPLAVEVIAARFNPGALEQAKVYPGGWQADPEQKEWLCDAFLQLRAFYVAAASGQYAMLLYIV